MISLYRLYLVTKEQWVLLYVGITKNVNRRMGEHQRKPWWNLVNHIAVTELACRERSGAEFTEAQTITRERPVYNMTHNGAPGTFRCSIWSDKLDDWCSIDALDQLEVDAERERSADQARLGELVSIGAVMPFTLNAIHDRYEENYFPDRETATVTPIRKEPA